MIKDSDLRFGNLLEYGDGFISVDINVLRDLSVYLETGLKPIRLTEDWLYRSNFVFYYRNPRMELFFYNTQSYYPFHLKIERDGYVYFNDSIIEYVHELQNIFKSNRGEELVFSSTEP